MTSIARTVARATIRAAGAITIAGLALGIASGPAAAATPAATPQTLAVSPAAYLLDTPNLPYGPDTCIVPFVWRAARPGDSVCVTVATRTATTIENAQGPSHHWIFGNEFCAPGYTFRAAYPATGSASPTPSRPGHRRQHPRPAALRPQPARTDNHRHHHHRHDGLAPEETELAPADQRRPHQPPELPAHRRRHRRHHDRLPLTFRHLARPDRHRPRPQPVPVHPAIDVVNTYPNMHKDPDGQLAWANGEPMDQAGYHTFRSEIVATGFATPADAIRFWMQNDAGSAWGHRNLILNCTTAEAGPAHLHSAPGGDYWTVDMGTK